MRLHRCLPDLSQLWRNTTIVWDVGLLKKWSFLGLHAWHMTGKKWYIFWPCFTWPQGVPPLLFLPSRRKTQPGRATRLSKLQSIRLYRKYRIRARRQEHCGGEEEVSGIFCAVAVPPHKICISLSSTLGESTAPSPRPLFPLSLLFGMGSMQMKVG